MKEFHILNLGAGVQSTTLYLQNMDGDIGPRYDAAIFADTQEEPRATYDHLEWMKEQGGPPILVRTNGSLGENLAKGRIRTKGFSSIPAYTASTEGGGDKGITRRQCTADFKIDVIERCIRREIVGLKKRQHMPKDVMVYQSFGISRDEASRAHRIYQRGEKVFWQTMKFPLLEMRWNRTKCNEYLKDRVPHKVVRSACHFCPYHSDKEWKRIRDTDPEGWKRALEVDQIMRTAGNRVNQGMNKALYLHPSCVPLDKLDLDKPNPQFAFDGFLGECDGLCGN